MIAFPLTSKAAFEVALLIPIEPVTFTEPVNTWVLDNELPNTLDPELYSVDAVTVCTTNVCAVKIPATLKLFAKDDVWAYDALTAFKIYEAVWAFCT